MKTTNTAKILYIEDDYDDRFFLNESAISFSLPAEINYASDGTEALDYLKKSSNKNLPSLIVLDLNMPKLDGKETLEIIKEDPYYSQIPVIVLSTSENKEDKDFCKSKGVNSYLIKPGHFNEYELIIKSFLPFLPSPA
jgi:CheY-like chemotaxis protein